MKCGALIVAAGSSSRLGQPKQLVLLNGKSLLDRSIDIAKDAGFEPVVVVLGAHETLIREHCKLHDVMTVSNSAWSEGMGTSIARGVLEFADVVGIVVMTCDMPAVTADHLRKLASSHELTASAYAGRKGVPAYFPNEFFSALLALRGELGARELLRPANVIDLNGGEWDIDTLEDLNALMTRPIHCENH